MDETHEQEAFRLDCGEEVSLRGFYCHVTYGGYLEGQLERINERILSKAPTYIDKVWGTCKTVVLPLPEEEFSRQLPRWQVYVWLRSHSPIKDGDDGSELYVVFFRHSIMEVSINTLVYEAVRSIDWRAEAQGFTC